MRFSRYVTTVALAAACSASFAQSERLSETSAVSAVVSVALPISLVSAGSTAVSQSVSNLSDRSRWQVTQLKAQPGDKTEAKMHSDDGRFDLTMTVPTATVREQRLTVGDAIDIDRIGDAGYAVRKGTATLGVVPRADSGMLHSQARH